MTNAYRWVQWNRHKRVYDTALGVGCALFLGVFVGVSLATRTPPNEIRLPILLLRALATLAIVLLHVILCIGPLARLNDRFAPLLYNRRHLGVTFFLVALAHALLAILYYGGFGVRNPVAALLDSPVTFGAISGFPFEILGFLALVIFFVMAATSHDFWLANLTARAWKALHMLVYLAYALIVLHVVLGVLQSERSPVYAGALLAGVALVATLHTVAGFSEWRRDRQGAPNADGWIDAGDAASLGLDEGRVVVCGGGERIAVFRTSEGVVAMTNACAHQGGPLGEGRIVGGCVTCPWHGYQYLPENGQSPPPYTEKIPTHNARIVGGRIQVSATPNAPGTPTTPATPANEDGGDA